MAQHILLEELETSVFSVPEEEAERLIAEALLFLRQSPAEAGAFKQWRKAPSGIYGLSLDRDYAMDQNTSEMFALAKMPMVEDFVGSTLEIHFTAKGKKTYVVI